MTTSDESLKAVKEYADDYELDLSWLDTRGEWGIRAEPDKRGLPWPTFRWVPTATHPTRATTRQAGHVAQPLARTRFALAAIR